MSETNFNPTMAIDQAESCEQWQANLTDLNQLKENITFLAGALRVTINLEDKSKVSESLELCICLVREIYQRVEAMAHDIPSAGATLRIIEHYFNEPGFGDLSHKNFKIIKEETGKAYREATHAD